MSPACRRPVLLSSLPGGSCDGAAAEPRHPHIRHLGCAAAHRVRWGRPLPLPRPVPVPAPEDAVYGIGRIDASGRIADRAVTSALGWSGGDRLTLTADAGAVTARRDPGGMITLPARAYIPIPAPCAAAAEKAAADLHDALSAQNVEMIFNRLWIGTTLPPAVRARRPSRGASWPRLCKSCVSTLAVWPSAERHSAPFSVFPAGCGTSTCASRPLLSLPSRAARRSARAAPLRCSARVCSD
jgi:hypothetical protein